MQLYFFTEKTVQKILNKIGMKIVNRIDLPGHRIYSSNMLISTLSLVEYFITKIIRKGYFGIIDIVPRFVLVAELNKDIEL